MPSIQKCASFLSLICAGSVALTACGSYDELRSLLASQEADTAQVVLDDLYSDQWTEFAIACPYTPSDLAKAELGVEDTPWSDKWPDEQTNYLLLKSDTGKNWWAQHSRAKIDLCSPQSKSDLLLKPIATKLEFTFNHVSGSWTLE